MNTTFLSLLWIMAIGVIFGRIHIVDCGSIRRTIGKLVLNVFLPALTFSVFVDIALTNNLWITSLISTSVVVVCGLLSYLVYGVLLRGKIPRNVAGALILGSTWGNATYIGLPIVTALVGPEYSAIPLMFDMVGMTPLLFSIGTIICVEYGTSGNRHTFAEGVKQIFTLPPILTAILGLAVNMTGIPIPEFITSSCVQLGSAVIPLMIFTIGMALRIPDFKSIPLLSPAIAIKLLVAPVVGFLLIPLLTSHPQTSRALLLETAMPTMMLTIVLAENYGLDDESLAQLILFTTVISMFTLPFIAGIW
ncbi:MAG: AEC family transporter [Ignavibacteria bacterium]|nr:AEC family transporter [Ignavibacteria bacterium]